VGDVLQQKIAELRGKKMFQEVGKTIGSGLLASAIILVLSVIVGFTFYFLLGAIIDKDVTKYPNLQVAFVISIIATGMSLVSFSMSGINQGLHNSANVAIATLLANVLFLVLNIIFLFLGYGVISIAFANMCRSLFINVYNGVSMQQALKKEKLFIEFHFQHFKQFIKIFSFTSASRIISGISGSIDMIILARFIPPSMITIFEINRRPINMTQGLIGRHSVALMPLISHGKGKEDHREIISFIGKQFRIYSYAALFTSFIFLLSYRNLISLWTGSAQYAGDTIVHLLVANFFFGLIGYFMSNMGYALGDIKMNSLINIVKGLSVALLIFFVAGRYGIKGTLIVSLCIILITDFFYFTYRLNKIGYLKNYLLKSIASAWVIIIPVSWALIWALNAAVEQWFKEDMYMPKLIVSSASFTVSFVLILLLVDTEIRNLAKQLRDKLFLARFRPNTI
jgi:O-antigen/teichoic acid export membrane protein